MPLASGSHLGPYQIIALIGSGGMGEVYRARDPEIGREVAIKILPSIFTQNPDRLRRFESEARSAGSLNHPNILIVHALGNQEGCPYLVSELLQGETLRQHLRNGISQKEALELGRQLATGLAAAHDKGITHRDLKPENIFVTKEGRVKILDFGLAKLTESNQPDEISSLPTSPATEAGIVLGTVGYMSPEQVRGNTADSRSDIFSFGLVLFEMLIGRPAFREDSSVETMNAILKEDPMQILETDANISPALVRVVRHCLEKNPTARFQSAHDLAFALESLPSSQNVLPVSRAVGMRQRRWFVWMIVAMIIAALAGIVRLSTQKRQLPSVVASSILPPQDVVSAFHAGFALSPDGKTLAFSALSKEGKRQIWLRSLQREDAYPLAGTDRGSFPFWSPDSTNIAFYGGGYLKRVAASGGPVRTLCRSGLVGSRGGVWSPDGSIIFTTEWNGTLHRVSAEGGEPSNIFADKASIGLAWPAVSPDGKHLLFASRMNEDCTYGASFKDLTSRQRIGIGSVRGGHVEFGTPTQILYVKNRILQAQQINLKTGTLLGEPVAIADHIASPVDWEAFSVSQEGTLVVYSTDTAESLTSNQLLWVDRAGNALNRIPLPGSIWTVRVSHNGQRVVYNRGDHIWLYDSHVGEPVPLTHGAVSHHWPVWSPDDTRIAIHTTEPFRDVYRTFEQPIEAPASLKNILPDDAQHFASIITDWSSDGRRFLVNNNLWNTDVEIFDRSKNKLSPYLATTANEMNAVFSPDNNWIAYQSDETGDFEVYVRPLNRNGGSRRLSSGGGGHPRWAASGQELFYVKPDGSIMSIEIQTKPALQIKSPKFLFKMLMAEIINGTSSPYDVSPDGQRFLIIVPLSGPPSLTLIQNWTSLTKN